MTENIRNFCIIAHIDHGKSTLADRFLEFTDTVSERKMKAQLLDSMDIERERGITIKLTPVRIKYKNYILNLIDTPGHVDFNYEVSRSLAAVEGAILLVDATQGVQAQTIGNLYLAIDQNLKIIPVINKIDMPNADVDKTSEEIINLIGGNKEDIILVSAKTGQGVTNVLEAVIKNVPAPKDTADQPPRALIFDSMYNEYKGVVASIRIMDGELKKGEKINFMTSGAEGEILDIGYYTPGFYPTDKLSSGETGYVITGLKEVSDCRVGDTITTAKIFNDHKTKPLPGYKEVKPMIFAGVFPKEGNKYEELRDAVEKLKLNDASLYYEPEHAQALGFGFRCGFLGMLHLDIFQERLKREYGVEIIITVPSVAYKIDKADRTTITIHSPQEMPDPTRVKMVYEPWMTLDVISPKEFVGNIMGLLAERKGHYLNTEYLSAGVSQRAILHYEIPLSSLITDFYDKLKTVSSGYASMNYEYKDYEPTEVVKLDIIIADDQVESLSTLVWKEDAFKVGKKIVNTLKDSLPRQNFVIKIQAAVGGKVVAGEKISAYRKDVTAGLYGGDVTRKRKVLEKQKKGKKRMMAVGKVDIPTEVYLKVLKK
jgi:GTP-binding protein LepA